MEVSKEVHDAWIAGIDEGVSLNSALAVVAVPDEREAFEVEILKYTPHAILDCHDGQYTNPWVQAAWTGFQVGAALADTSAPLEKLRVNPESEPVAKYAYGEKTALLDVVALSLALESAKKQLAVSPAAAPVVLPEPVYTMRVNGRMHSSYTPTMSAFDLEDGEHKLYTEQQVRALLATGGQVQAEQGGE